MKRPRFEPDTTQEAAFRALQQREEAEREIVIAAVLLERAPVGPARVALWEPFAAAIRKYNQAEADLHAAQRAIDARARSR